MIDPVHALLTLEAVRLGLADARADIPSEEPIPGVPRLETHFPAGAIRIGRAHARASTTEHQNRRNGEAREQWTWAELRSKPIEQVVSRAAVLRVAQYATLHADRLCVNCRTDT